MQISLMSGLIEDSWSLISASAFKLLRNVLLGLIYMKKVLPNSYVVDRELY